MVAPVSPQLAFARFVDVHESDGLRQALAYLLGLTDYRFIGIWRFADGKANAAVHFDRENPQVLNATEVPDTATYCCYVRESGQAFRTADSLADDRVSAHPARDTVRTYCGVPVMDSAGTVLGTLCHYDLVPLDAEQVDLELMLMVSSYLAQGDHVPPYPAAVAAAAQAG